MPEGYRKHRPFPGQGYSLKDAAADGVLLIVRCTLCNRMRRYLASDLVEMLDPGGWADHPPFPYAKCGRWDAMSVKFHHPSPGDYGHLVVRRPAGVKRTQMWKDVKLGDGA